MPAESRDSLTPTIPLDLSGEEAAPTEMITVGTARRRAGEGPFQPGDQVGTRYTIIRLLGAGGMGAVYQAFDHELGVGVAIKVIRPPARDDEKASAALEQRFKRELVLARQITHKHVVRIHDIGDIDGIKYLTMPFVDGETLASVLLRDGTVPVPRAIAIATQVARGLAAAHDEGIVHRDLKPENIMIENESGDALIMDFGIARTIEHGHTQTAKGSVIGTLAYMAPEQGQGKHLDHRADQYALGLIVYDMLTGQQRLIARENTMAELVARMAAAPPPLRQITPDIPEALDAIVTRCLQPSPAARFETTHDLVAALEALTPEGHLRPPVRDAGGTSPPRVSPRMAMAAVAIVILGATGGWLLSQRNAGTPAAGVPAREPISLLIADFDNQTGDPVLDGVIEQAIGLGIEGASFITAYPRRDALRAAAVIKPGSRLDPDTAILVARREGIGVVLAGGIAQQGTAYRISARAVSGRDEQTLYTLEVTADGKTKILETVGQLAGQVRTALGDTAVPKEGLSANETFTSASLEAAGAYARAQELQFAGRPEEAITHFEQAIALDPDMGRAYSGIASQYVNLGRSSDADKYYQEALARIDRMTEREKLRTRGSYYLFSGKPQQAIREYNALVAAYPGDTAALTNLAFAHSQLRNFSEAMAVAKRASGQFPNNVINRNNAALYAMYAGQFEVVLAESAEVLKLNPAYVRGYLARALSLMALGRVDEAVKTYEDLKQVSAAGASFASAGLADAALYQGRTDEAIAILREGIAADRSAKNGTAQALKHAAMGEAMLARGDRDLAAREADAALAISQSNAVALRAGLTLAKSGRSAAAQKVVAMLDRKLEADPRAYALLIQAEINLAQKQPRAAIDQIREAQQHADTWIGRVAAARAQLDLGAAADAQSEVETAARRSGEATAITLDEWPTFHFFAEVNTLRNRIAERLQRGNTGGGVKP